MPKVFSINCFKLLRYEILWLVLPGRGYKMYSIIIWPNGPCSSLQLCQTCPIPVYDTAYTQNMPPKHSHLKYQLTNQTSTIFWNTGHWPLSMTQCLTGRLYPCLHIQWGNGSTGSGQPIHTVVSITGISITPTTSYHCCNPLKLFCCCPMSLQAGSWVAL